MNQMAIIQKSKNTLYKHNMWFYNGSKTVYEAIKYYVNSKDFRLTLKPSIKFLSQIENSSTLSRYSTVKDIVEFCIKNIDTHWKYLTIKGERGSDRGKLKIQTFVAYRNIKDAQETVKSELV